MVGGYDTAESFAGLIIVFGFTGCLEGGEFLFDFFFCERAVVLDEDEAVVGLIQVLGLDKEFLVELLARSEADFLYFYVLRFHEADHAFGKIQDSHGLAHVKHEELAVVGHGSRGKNQLAGLRYGHEVSYDSLVRDGNGATLGDLLPEQGDYGARTSQYVAEPSGAVFHLVVRVCACTLDQHLAYSLGCTHESWQDSRPCRYRPS